MKELAGFDFDAQPSIDLKQIRDLAASRWNANGENVLPLGPRLCGAQLRCDASARRILRLRS